MLLDTLAKEYEWVSFQSADNFIWAPQEKTVYFDESAGKDTFEWSLLHELSHALLDHQDFDTDFNLLQLEVDAWKKAKEIATKYGITIDEDHIQDCLDTYRDWLHKRSKCPECLIVNPQVESGHYTCFNCGQHWSVSDSQLCSVQIKEYIS